jgi:dihydroorotate dehydrogenase (fumarate)
MDLLELRLMNAAGHCKDVEAVERLAKTPVTEITVGSITMATRSGNDGSTFWQSEDGVYTLNSLGLPNRGIDYYNEAILEMYRIANGVNKRLRLSIAGFSPHEYFDLTCRFGHVVDTLEINLGCPNVWGDGGQKPIAAFNIELMKSILDTVGEAVQDHVSHRPRIAVKLSPYSDPSMIDKVVEVLNDERELVDEIVTCNTFPNAFAWDGAKPAITPGGGFAGMSGKAMKGIALGQVAQFRAKLDSSFKIAGVGGASCGADILDLVRAGADSVQVGTHYFVHGEKVFSEMSTEYSELV